MQLEREPAGDASLLAALRAHGVRYLTDDPRASGESVQSISPQQLLAGLAQASDPRLRYTIAPLLLVRPELAPLVPPVARSLSPAAKDVLVEAYTAAVYLQRAWQTRLRRYLGEQSTLPPLWIDELGLPDPDERFGRSGLAALRARQRRGATARHSIYEQVALNLFGQLVAERATQPAATAA